MEDNSKKESLIYDPFTNFNYSDSVQDTSNEVTHSEQTSEQCVHSIGELTLNSASDQKKEQTATFEQANDILFEDDAMKSAEVFIHFEILEQNFIIDDSKFIMSIKSNQLIRISERTRRTDDMMGQELDESVGTLLETSGNETSTVSSSSPSLLSVSTPRTPLTMAGRDQLRAMIVLLNESNSVLLKIRQRFPLSASTRCDVIHCQIQTQLQELFGEFRNNDENRFKAMIPQNRQTFLTIWDHLATLIVDSCYRQ